MGGYDRGNFVDIYFYFDGRVYINCWTSGSGIGYGTGYYDGGGCDYLYPEEESLEYLNIIAFIKEKTWIKNDVCKFIGREEYETILKEIGYTE